MLRVPLQQISHVLLAVWWKGSLALGQTQHSTAPFSTHGRDCMAWPTSVVFWKCLEKTELNWNDQHFDPSARSQNIIAFLGTSSLVKLWLCAPKPLWFCGQMRWSLISSLLASGATPKILSRSYEKRIKSGKMAQNVGNIQHCIILWLLVYSVAFACDKWLALRRL